MQRCLMLGAGFTKLERKIKATNSAPESETEWVSLDMNPDCHPDVVFNLEQIEKGKVLPFPDDHFDEIHGYEVMEHFGRIGDFKGFFTGMRELWRILKPGGIFFGASPAAFSIWAFGDPGHTRVMSAEMFSYLSPRRYEKLGACAASDYRRYVAPCWWEFDCENIGDSCQWALMKSRIVA